MIFYKKKIIIQALIILFYISKALANESEPYYVTGLVEYGFIGNPGVTAPTSGSITYGFGINAGYEFNEYLAVDVGSNFIPSNLGSLMVNDVALRASLPFGNFASGFIHMGPGYIVNTNDANLENSLGIFMGIGALFDINTKLAISIEDQGIIPFENTNRYTVNMVTTGFVYGF